MSPEKVKALLPVLTAYAQGKTIQMSDDGHKGWIDLHYAKFDCPAEAYRIKPDPIVIKYRRFLFKFSDNSLAIGITNHDMNLNSYIENRDDFVRWIDNDWITYECEV